MPEMTGAEAMFEFMVHEGLRYVFGNPATTELPLMNMFAARDEIKYTLALREDPTSASRPVPCSSSDTTVGSD